MSQMRAVICLYWYQRQDKREADFNDGHANSETNRRDRRGLCRVDGDTAAGAKTAAGWRNDYPDKQHRTLRQPFVAAILRACLVQN